MDVAVVRRLVMAHAASRAVLDLRAERAVRAILSRFDGWYSSSQIRDMTAEVVAAVEATQRQVAAVTDAYLARVATEITGRTIRPVGGIDPSGLRRGVTHQGVYGRVADQYRFHVWEGLSEREAATRAVLRGREMASMDTSLAFREQARKFHVVRDADAQRRVFHPELSREGSCGLCVVASDRLYGPQVLQPLHENCKCTVVPVMRGSDPGSQINADDLRAIYDAAGGTNRDQLFDVRVSVHEHGELGPVLRDDRHNFRGPAEVARDAA